MCGSSSAVERRLPKPKVAGSNPVSRSTRLSLDAIRVPGSAFSFAFSLAFMAGYLFCNATHVGAGVVSLAAAFLATVALVPLRLLFRKRSRYAFAASLVNARATRRLATNLFRAMMAWTLYPLKKNAQHLFCNSNAS